MFSKFKFICNEILIFFRNIKFYIIVTITIKFKRLINKRIFFFINTPEHGNLGDQAIVFSQYYFFKKMKLHHSIHEFKTSHYEYFTSFINKIIKINDVIIINGGGNMGSLWFEKGELFIRNIIETFKQNTIFVFPQTVYYSNSEEDKMQIIKSISIYNSHSRLFLCARELLSYDFFKNHYKNSNTLLVPDVVLSLSNINYKFERSGVIFCFRNDKEKSSYFKFEYLLKEYISNKGIKFKDESTVINKYITAKNRKKEVFNKLRSFSKSKLIITDRLHAMIFAAITGTPCLAFDNISKKVSLSYKWINHLKYIKLFDNHTFEDLYDIIDNLLILNSNKFDNSNLIHYFEELKSRIIKS